MKRKSPFSLCMIFLLVLSLALPSFGAAEAAEPLESFDASTMRLLKTSGDVQILDLEGVPRFVLENVRFASGETMVTGEDSLASVGLDDSKIVTLDALTRVLFIQEAEHMLLNLLEGQIFIDVSEKLDENASFDIQTTTMTVGIRGTLIFGRVLPAEKPGDPAVTEFGVMEGSGRIDTTDSSGTRRVFNVSAGEIVTASDAGDGQGASFEVRPMTAADTQGFVQDVANSSEQLQQRVIHGSPNGEQFLAPPQGGESTPSIGTGNQYPADGTWSWDQPVQVVAQSASKLYDGETLRRPDGALVSGLPETCSIAVSCSGSRTDAGTAVNRVDHYVISNSLGQDITGHFTNVQTVDGILRVDPAPLTVWTGSAEKVYDGEPLTCDKGEVRTVPGYMAEEPVWRNTSVVSRTTLGAETMVGVCGSVWVHGSNPLTGEEKEIELKTGQRLVVSLSDEGGKESISFTVETLKVSQLPDDVLRLYADNPELMVQACADVPEWDPAELRTLVAGLDSSANTVNRNGLAVAAEIAGDVMTDSSNLRITMDSGVTNYTTQVLTGTVAHFVPISLDPSIRPVLTGKQEGIGESENTCDIDWGTAEPDNYTVTYDLGTLKIEPLAVEIHCGGVNNVVYRGKSYLPWPALTYLNGTRAGERIYCSRVTGSLPGAFVSDARLRAASHTYHFVLFTGDTLDLVISGFGTRPGTYTLSGSVTSSSPNLDSISLSFTGSRLVIEPAELTITTGSAEKKYDGKPLTCPDVSVTGLVGDDTVTVTATGKQTEQGASANTYTIDWGDTDPSCYKITENLGTLTVKKPAAKKTTLTISTEPQTKVYDGEPLAVSDEEIQVAGLQDGDKINVYIGNAEITDAGSVTPTFRIDWGSVDKNKYDVKEKPGKLTVKPATLQVTTPNDSKTYDGYPLPETTDQPTLTGLIDGETAYVETRSDQITDAGTKDNEYIIVWETAKEDNYDIKENLGTLTVKPLGVTFGVYCSEATYDGTTRYGELAVMCETGGWEQVGGGDGTWIVTHNSGAQVTVTSTGVRNAGTTTPSVSYSFTSGKSSNFSVTTESSPMTIYPRRVTLTSASDSKEYDGNPLTNHNVSVSGDGWADGEGATYSFTGSQTDAGSSANSFDYTLNSGTSAGNYEITKQEGTLTVTRTLTKVTFNLHCSEGTYEATLSACCPPRITGTYEDGTAVSGSSVQYDGPESAYIEATIGTFTLLSGETITITCPDYRIPGTSHTYTVADTLEGDTSGYTVEYVDNVITIREAGHPTEEDG